MHLAAELNTPVVGVFTCTNAVRSGPAGPIHELVSTNVRCAGSYRKKCPYRGRRHMACMEELDVERVWIAFCRLVQKTRPKKDAA
jgi:heptosyltransferase-1